MLYNLATHNFFISRDVSFREDSFPFQNTSPSSNIFLDISPTEDSPINDSHLSPPHNVLDSLIMRLMMLISL